MQTAYHSRAAEVYNLVLQLYSLLLQHTKVFSADCYWLIKHAYDFVTVL